MSRTSSDRGIDGVLYRTFERLQDAEKALAAIRRREVDLELRADALVEELAEAQSKLERVRLAIDRGTPPFETVLAIGKILTDEV